MELLKAIKVLSSLISSQMITFRKAAIAKLYKQINEQCETVYAIMTSFLNQYNRMYAMYVCSAVIITNINEINKFFLSLSNCYKNFENLIKKIKDEKIKKTWQENIKPIKIVQVRGNAEISTKFINMITQGIISPIVACAATIVAYEKELKKHTRISQYSLGKELEILKSLKVTTQKKLPKTLALCNTGAEETLKQLKLQKEQAKKKKNNKLLLQIAELQNDVREIISNIQTVEVSLSGVMNEADQALKIAKYSTGENVEILINLKSILKQMVNYAKEVFEIMKDPKTTEKQRETKIILITKKISIRENDIETTITKVVWTKTEDEVGQSTTDIRMKINKVSQKFTKLNSSTEVRKLYAVIIQWSKAKPNTFITFVKKYGKYIIMALGFISTLI